MPFLIAASAQLGPTLKGLRKQRSMTQDEVARLSGLGQKTVSLLETAPQRSSVDSLVRYLAAIRVTISLNLLESSRTVADEAW